MENYYAGIGSRKTPEDICRKMFTAGWTLAKLGFVLRSGGANGADLAFESGVSSYIESKSTSSSTNDEIDAIRPEIYLPFKGFNKNSSILYGSTSEARAIAKKFHPRWEVLSCLGRDFHARNVYQVLGPDLKTPSSFVLCWTPNGKITGGTGQALRIAEAYSIPVLNFAIHDDQHISDFILSQAERLAACTTRTKKAYAGFSSGSSAQRN